MLNDYWKLLNTQSCMDCDEAAFEKHSLENEKLLYLLESTAGEKGGSWIIRSSYIDFAHQHRKEAFEVVKMHGLREFLDSKDLKNGFDVGFIPAHSPSIALITHGTGYSTPTANGYITELACCYLLSHETTHQIEEKDNLSVQDLKNLFHDKEKHASLQPCIKACKKALDERTFAWDVER